MSRRGPPLGHDDPWAKATGDSKEIRFLAASVRDEATLHPSADTDYDAALHETWGGPPNPRWFEQAMIQYPEEHAPQRGRRVLVTGGASGIGFYAAKLLAAVGMVIILPARPNLEHEAFGAAEAIRSAVPHALIDIPPVGLDLASFASVREFSSHLRANGSAIDVLCLNAGRGGSDSDTIERTEDGAEVIRPHRLRPTPPACRILTAFASPDPDRRL